MKEIYYKSSDGEIIKFTETPYKMLTDTDLFNYSWEWETQGKNFPKITTLKKSLVSPSFSIVVSGLSKDDMLNNVEHLISVFDADCYRGEMGRLYVGNFYRDCYITASTKSKTFEKNITTIQFVATSDEPNWKNDKTVTFSGEGTTIGEIAYKLLISARVNDESIVAEATGDDGRQIHLEYVAPFGSNWLEFDIGSVIDVDEFSGLTLEATGTPISCDLQISDGETVDDSRSIEVTANIPNIAEESSRIYIDDFTIIKVDSVSLNSATLYMYCYIDYERVAEITIKNGQINIIGEDIDVSNYDYITFFSGYNQQATNTVSYTVNEEQWTTLQSISSAGEVTFTNQTCRYIRIRGSYFGRIDSDVSLISGEDAPVRNLLYLGYQLENIQENIVEEDGDVYYRAYTLSDASKNGYVYFDDKGINLQYVGTDIIRGSGLYLEGLNNNQWQVICEITPNMDDYFDDTYNQLRLKMISPSIPYIDLDILCKTDAKVYNESYAPSEAVIEIKGAWNNPSVKIGDIVYGADYELPQGHTLVIDTKNKTVRDYTDDSEEYENIFETRLDDTFQKVDSGEQDIDWYGNATEIKITLEQARSDPKWN